MYDTKSPESTLGGGWSGEGRKEELSMVQATMWLIIKLCENVESKINRTLIFNNGMSVHPGIAVCICEE